MHLFDILAHILLLVGFSQLVKALSCDASKGKLLECGKNVKKQDKCPQTCCFNRTGNPPCYFKEKDYGPIQHANGLCISKPNESDNLVWSRDCTSRNAFFVVINNYQMYHVATGKCVAPVKYSRTYWPPYYFLQSNHTLYHDTYSFCKWLGLLRLNRNGSLRFRGYHAGGCIGSSFAINNQWQPRENEKISIDKYFCYTSKSCKFNYVIERKFSDKENLVIICNQSCSNWTIEVRSAVYGVFIKEKRRYIVPYKISSKEKECLSSSALSVVKENCNGKSKCAFTIQKDKFLPKSYTCSNETSLVVHYTCKTATLVINKCLSNPCNVNANCTDNEGTFECRCKKGFSGNGLSCTNINECLSNPCNASASCIDNEGSFECRFIFSLIRMKVNYKGFAGDLLEIKCWVSGPLFPIFKWKMGSLILSRSTRVKIETNRKISKLFVRKTMKSDSGVYFCTARKGAESITSNVSINVKIAPVISVYPLSISATEGDLILLTCHVVVGEGRDIKILWFNSSKPTESMYWGKELNLTNRIALKTNNRYQEKYWCTATNSDGKGRSQNVSVFVVSKGYKDYCSAETARRYNWERTPVGSTVVKKCFDKQIGFVSRSCLQVDGSPTWHHVNVSQCRSAVVVDLVDQISRLDGGFLSNNVSEIIQQTEVVTEDGELFEQDVRDIVFILKTTQTKTATQNDQKNFIQSSSNIFATSRKEVWENIQDRNTLVTEIIKGVDINAKNLVASSGKPRKVLLLPNIQIVGVNLPENQNVRLEDINLTDSGGEGVKFRGIVADGIKQAIVVKYSSVKDILSPEELQKSSGFVDPVRMCVFIEPSVKESKWSREGCDLNEQESSEDQVICDCDHNTAFAIMMHSSDIQNTSQSLDVQYHLLDFCKAVAALLHFFLLSAFGWMLCEGILLYTLLIRIFNSIHGKHIKIFNIIGWGSDFLCSALAKVNFIVLTMVIRKVMNAHIVRQQENVEKIKTGLRATVVILPVLGLTWVFGLMAIDGETVFFRYLFAIFNSAQGWLIFLFHCVLNKQMRDAVGNSLQSIFSSKLGGKKSTDLPNGLLNTINQFSL
ncbi:uncharacterized protein LOC124452154 [Xenia sp. Carnegie-2017]|uniref:uncharacterized protein LOC124452154 n=1 Tax=Xenia sp. Carnegie-2017 TaxID=2897299 RepID=UPI001F04097F|nr:uncharacterized protein LOC124452154 [Xenia sp. Carnegie-2017]